MLLSVAGFKELLKYCRQSPTHTRQQMLFILRQTAAITLSLEADRDYAEKVQAVS